MQRCFVHTSLALHQNNWRPFQTDSLDEGGQPELRVRSDFPLSIAPPRAIHSYSRHYFFFFRAVPRWWRLMTGGWHLKQRGGADPRGLKKGLPRQLPAGHLVNTRPWQLPHDALQPTRCSNTPQTGIVDRGCIPERTTPDVHGLPSTHPARPMTENPRFSGCSAAAAPCGVFPRFLLPSFVIRVLAVREFSVFCFTPTSNLLRTLHVNEDARNPSGS